MLGFDSGIHLLRKKDGLPDEPGNDSLIEGILVKEIFVAPEAEIADGGRKVIVADAVEIGVFRLDGAYYAWRNECPHQGGPICQGRVMKGVEERLDGERRSLGIHYAEGV